MLQLILLIAGVFYALRKAKIKALTVVQYPHVPPEIFFEWQAHELRSAALFLRAAWGLFVVSIPLYFIVAARDKSVRLFADAAILALVFVFMHMSDVAARKAARLEKQFRIKMPK